MEKQTVILMQRLRAGCFSEGTIFVMCLSHHLTKQLVSQLYHSYCAAVAELGLMPELHD